MTLAEFKAWFSGFTEDMEGPPSAKQWDKIKAKVKDIDGTPVTYPVYVAKYQPYYGWYYPNSTELAQSSAATVKSGLPGLSAASFDSMKAMLCLGREEAKN